FLRHATSRPRGAAAHPAGHGPPRAPVGRPASATDPVLFPPAGPVPPGSRSRDLSRLAELGFHRFQGNPRLAAPLLQDHKILKVFPEPAVFLQVDQYGLRLALAINDVLHALHATLLAV